VELERQLHEQRNIKERIEAERDKAVDASEEAARKDRDTMIQLDHMSAMTEEGKTLIAANEKLHKSLHLEIDKRKALYNKFEDQKGRIRVYVRIRPFSGSENSKSCTQALVKEDKRTCVILFHRTYLPPLTSALIMYWMYHYHVR